MAPMLVVASIAATACGMFGRQATTRSPGRTPNSLSLVASTRTWPASVSQASAVTGVVSLLYSSAVVPGRSLRSTCSA